jgi:amicoumacin kinase
MWIPGQKEVNRAYALLSADLWGADASTIEHLGDFGNSVYAFTCAGKKRILRLTDPIDRAPPVNQAELDFLLYLHNCGVQVSIPLPSRLDHLIEPLTVDETLLLASVFEFAPGVQVDYDSVYWAEPFFHEWGRTLAQIHLAARSFESVGTARWQWMDEDLIANADHYLPTDDILSRRQLDALLEGLNKLPISRDNFGLTHADFGPRNFHYQPDRGITAFDFGNSCYHWFVSDIAISLSLLRHYPTAEREQYRTWILAGYQAIFSIDPQVMSHLSEFIRLRILYVYLDRLMLFGVEPSESQRETLHLLRRKVHEQFEW